MDLYSRVLHSNEFYIYRRVLFGYPAGSRFYLLLIVFFLSQVLGRVNWKCTANLIAS